MRPLLDLLAGLRVGMCGEPSSTAAHALRMPAARRDSQRASPRVPSNIPPCIRAADPEATLKYALGVSQRLVVSREFRSQVCAAAARHTLSGLLLACPAPAAAASCRSKLRACPLSTTRPPACLPSSSSRHPQVLRLVVRLYGGLPQPDLAAVCQCLMWLGDADEVAAILFKLLG